MNKVVLDSSAALAMLLGEPGGDRVMQAYLSQEDEIAMSAVNWSEVITILQRKSSTFTAEKLCSMLPGTEIVPFGKSEAESTALLAKSFGALSLGDRACVALANALDATAWTADRIWATVPVPVKIELLR